MTTKIAKKLPKRVGNERLKLKRIRSHERLAKRREMRAAEQMRREIENRVLMGKSYAPKNATKTARRKYLDNEHRAARIVALIYGES